MALPHFPVRATTTPMSEVLGSALPSIQISDVTGRQTAIRTAVARGRVRVGEEAFQQIQARTLAKGDVLTVAQVAGILGAKQTSRLLPLCQDVHLGAIDVTFEPDASDASLVVRAFVKSHGTTGVGMEALTAVTIAALTVVDMCRSVSRDAEITEVRLVAKTGGASGDYLRPR